jgi:hypothetical protein
MMPSRVVLLSLALLTLPTLVRADVYKCAMPGGKVLYQNAPCGNGVPVVHTQPSAASTPVARLPRVEAPLPVPPPDASSPPGAQAESTPVDTRQFGLLPLGATEREIVHRLGAPSTIVEEPRVFVGGRVRGGGVHLREKRRATWVYRGDNYTMTTLLTVEDGVLVHKAKRPY